MIIRPRNRDNIEGFHGGSVYDFLGSPDLERIPSGGVDPVTNLEWQTLAEDRRLDAETLLAAQRWSAAYYLVGYAVECGLKACILSYVASSPDIIFIKRNYSDKCWSHNPEELLRLADLEVSLNGDMAANPDLRKNWGVVNSWAEVSRYHRQKDQATAEELFRAVTDQPNGVLQWLRDHY